MKPLLKNKKTILSLVFFTLLLLSTFINSCKSISESSPTSTDTTASTGGGNGTGNNNFNVTLTGQVTNANSGSGVDSVFITVDYGKGKTTKYTDSQGKYSIQITIDTNKTIYFQFSKQGFQSDSTSLFILPGKSYNLTTIQLIPSSVNSTWSGKAASIYLLGQSSLSLGVRSSGAIETGSLYFQVLDSLGRPINLANKVLVKFKLGGNPNGGEFLNPTEMYSDVSGIVRTFLTSGTKAGVVQIIAETQVDNRLISSTPVTYAIHSGLPDKDHFSMAFEFGNVPGLVRYGFLDKISAYVGDKYGNPVRTGTTIYFTSTGGIIEGSSQTNSQGIGGVQLITAAPAPIHPILGPGFGTITATTSDETFTAISTSGPILFSGYPIISITPSTFDIPHNGSQSFIYEVKDLNGNPMCASTSVSVSSDGEDVKTIGETNIQIPDTQSKAWTKFGFELVDSDSANPRIRKVYITVKSEGINGKGSLTISGIVR